MGRGPTERIDGWKSIAAELGRDRSTAIRWAKERALPVHALPGGKSRSVYALRHELDAWMRGQDVEGSEGEPAPTPADIRADAPRLDDTAPSDDLDPVSARAPIENEAEPDTPSGLRPLVRSRRIVAVSGTIGMIVALLAASGRLERTPAALAAPATSQLVQARDDLATRSEGRLDTARTTLTMLAQRHPDNAPIQEALAEAWILAREYGSEPDALAFDRAGAAAAAARRIDPASAGADRVEGVVAYWWDRDPVRAGIAFRRAITRAPQDPLAHLWYANILTDNGEDAAAEREFTAARMLLPGAPYLLADYAWGLWSAGKETDAVAQLKMLSAYTDLASVPDCLSVIALATGDVTDYARHLRARAVTRRHAELTAYSQAVDRALALGGTAGRQAAFAVMLSRAISLAENADHPDHSWPAFVAHAASDQAQLLAILREARARGEHWGAAGFVRRIRVRWGGDAAILRELDALAQPHIEESGTATRSPV
jgi:tetratricopeptide (TPR) repeat protein